MTQVKSLIQELLVVANLDRVLAGMAVEDPTRLTR